MRNSPLVYTDPSGHATTIDGGISPLTKLIEEEFGTGGWDEYYTIGEFSHAVRSGLSYAVSETDDSHTQRHLAANRATDRLEGPGGDYWEFTKLSIFGWLYGDTWIAAAAAAEDMLTSQMMMVGALYAPGPLSNGPNWTYEGETYPKFSFPQGDGHHTYPKALGGHPNQRLAYIPPSQHTGEGGVHPSLSKFEGGWLYPKRNKSGAMIVDQYGQQAVEDGLRRFYSQPEWDFLLPTFEAAVEFTHSHQ